MKQRSRGLEEPAEKTLHLSGRGQMIVVKDEDDIVCQVEKRVSQTGANLSGRHRVRAAEQSVHRGTDAGDEGFNCGDDMRYQALEVAVAGIQGEPR
jgi:hypothetical protein